MCNLNLTQWVGVLCAVIGLWLIYELLVSPFFHFLFVNPQPFEPWDILRLFMVPMLAAPGGFSLYFGSQLIRSRTRRNIKGTVACLAVLGALCLFGFIEPDGSRSEEEVLMMLTCFIMTFVGVGLYTVLARFLIEKEESVTLGFRDFIGRGVATVLAWEMWFLLSAAVRYFFPSGDYPFFVSLGSLPLFIGPVLVAWLSFKLMIRILERPSQTSPSC